MRSCPLRRSWTTRSSSWSTMSRPGAGYAPENPSGSRCLLDSNSTRTESYVAIHHGQSVSSWIGAPNAANHNGWQQNHSAEPGAGDGSENPGVGGSIPSQPTILFSRAARALRARGARLARTVLEVTRFGRLILVNRMTRAAEARAVVRDCSAPLEHGRVHDGVAPLTLRSPPSGARAETPRRNLGTLGRFVPSPPGRAILPPPSAARGRLA